MLIKHFIGELIAKGMSQSEIARKSGVRQPTVNRIYLGDSNASMETIAKIARAFGRHPSSFIEWEGPDGSTDDLTPVPASYRTIPVISYAQGGDNKYWEEGGCPVGNGSE